MLALLAEEGLSITRTGSSSSSSGLLLQGGIAYAYWIGEIVLMVIVAWVSVFRRYTTNWGKKYAPEPTVVTNDIVRTDRPIR
ncbi:MAG: hypothetical protein AELANPGJ_02927 [Anaerolineae bacterium]|nr:hypothetical protein [Anaerolineae bacterium]